MLWNILERLSFANEGQIVIYLRRIGVRLYGKVGKKWIVTWCMQSSFDKNVAPYISTLSTNFGRNGELFKLLSNKLRQLSKQVERWSVNQFHM